MFPGFGVAPYVQVLMGVFACLGFLLVYMFSMITRLHW